MPSSRRRRSWRATGLSPYDGLVGPGAAVFILLAAALLACTGGGEDSARDERMLQLEAKVRSLEDGQVRTGERLDDLDARLQELQEVTSKAQPVLSSKEQWAKGKDEWSLPDGTVLERTVSLAEDSGGEVHYVDHPGREDRSVLVAPLDLVDGQTPLIVSLHGFGGDSAYQSTYVPLHERVNTAGFALLLPNGHATAREAASGTPQTGAAKAARPARTTSPI